MSNQFCIVLSNLAPSAVQAILNGSDLFGFVSEKNCNYNLNIKLEKVFQVSTTPTTPATPAGVGQQNTSSFSIPIRTLR